MTENPLPPARRRPRMWVGAAAAGLALLVGGAAAAGAARSDTAPATATEDGAGDQGRGADAGERCGPGGPGGRGHGARGTITAIDGTTLTVESEDGATVTVTTSDDTRVTEATEGTLADIATGDTVRVMGPEGDDGRVAARAVIEVPARDEAAEGEAPEGGPGRGRGLVGTVASVDGTSLTVTTAAGETVTVTTDDDTEVAVIAALAVADLEVGDEVGVRAVADDDASDGSVAAQGIMVGEPLGLGPHGGPGGPGARGEAPPEGAPGADEAPPTTN